MVLRDEHVPCGHEIERPADDVRRFAHDKWIGMRRMIGRNQYAGARMKSRLCYLRIVDFDIHQ